MISPTIQSIKLRNTRPALRSNDLCARLSFSELYRLKNPDCQVSRLGTLIIIPNSEIASRVRQLRHIQDGRII